MTKFTIKQFNQKYKTDDDCLHEIFIHKYANLKKCSECNNKFSFYKIAKRKCYACAYCGYQLHPLANTIFHKSSTSLKNWFYAIFLFSTSKNGVSAKELERQLGVTYKCAYRIAQQIRKLFDESLDLLNNIVEVDETYYGGKEINKHKEKKTKNAQGRSTKVKIPIVGALERGGNVVVKVVKNTQKEVLQPFVENNISNTSRVKTDEYRSYKTIHKSGYAHETVDHSKKQYIKGDTHVNNLEGFWSQLKRSIHGTYHFVSSKHLQSYINEFTFRYNRKNESKPLFCTIIQKVWTLS